MLEGDNWWRGHAAAFLKYVRLSPNALRRGRVSQVSISLPYLMISSGNSSRRKLAKC